MARGGMREMGQYNTNNGTLDVHTTCTLVNILHVQIIVQIILLHIYTGTYYTGTNTTTTYIQWCILNWYKYYCYSTEHLAQRIAQMHTSMNDLIVYLKFPVKDLICAPCLLVIAVSLSVRYNQLVRLDQHG